jgi:glycosyltransferase involved in cell wall biosynthesis
VTKKKTNNLVYEKNFENLVTQFKNQLSFLMVGTIEPRKGYDQVIKAFEKLWQDNHQFNLVIVGKQGWMMDEFISNLKIHTELNKRLFWFNDLDDNHLELIYKNCSCLIAASYEEGFGLPLIEAMQYNVPIIARKIEVFVEILGEYAHYFYNDKNPETITNTILNWIKTRNLKGTTFVKSIKYSNWFESSQQLLQILIN